MFRTAFTLVVLLPILAAPIAYSQSASTDHPSVLDTSSLDPGVDPCTDFFTYSCGGWLKKNPIPPDKTSWGYSSKLADDNRVLLRQILEEAAAPAPEKDAVKQKIGDYYTACMDEKTIDAAGTKPLKLEFDRIDRLRSKEDIAALAATMPNRARCSTSAPTRTTRTLPRSLPKSTRAGWAFRTATITSRLIQISRTSQAYVAHVQKMFELWGIRRAWPRPRRGPSCALRRRWLTDR